MLCLICIEEIFQGDEIQCVVCNEFLHFSCAGFREEKFRKINISTKSNWSCSNCKCKKPSNSPIILPKKKSTAITDETLRGVIESVNFLSSQFDDFGQQLKNLISTVNLLKNENKRITEENLIIKNEMKTLSGLVNKLEQKSLNCNMEIVGVPEIDNEVCTNTIQQITAKLDTHVTIQNAFRIPSKFTDKPRKISVIFNAIYEKKKFMEQAKKLKLVTKDVNPTWKGSTIYFNDQMTSTYRNLFFKTRTTAKQVGYKYIWFKNNTIFVKKSDNSKVIIIDDENSISKIV